MARQTGWGEGTRRSAYHDSPFVRQTRSGLPRHRSRLLALAQTHETHASEVVVRSPLDKLERPNEHRHKPSAGLHFLRGQPFAPSGRPLVQGGLKRDTGPSQARQTAGTSWALRWTEYGWFLLALTPAHVACTSDPPPALPKHAESLYKSMRRPTHW